MGITNIARKKRMLKILIVMVLIFLALVLKIGYIQFVKGAELQTMAYRQQTLDRVINPKRGTIYDTTKKNILAISATAETVTITPNNIKKEDKEIVARAISDIFSLDYEKALAKVKKRTSIEFIVKKVEKEKTDLLRTWMKENNIENRINIDEDTKRYYPNNTLASNIIGFCGDDNQGLNGIEIEYDSILKGKTRKNYNTNKCDWYIC